MKSKRAKGEKIIKALKALNIEQRGHEILNYLDEDPCEVGVTNINVPCIADCRQIARENNVRFHTYNSWRIGMFEIE